jgi:hypothetical protein
MDMKNLILVFVAILISSGCATCFEDLHIRQQEASLYTGMSYYEVVKIVGREPNPARDTILQGTDSEGQWMTWVVGQSKLLRSNSNFTQTYHLKFRNRKLTEWWSS